MSYKLQVTSYNRDNRDNRDSRKILMLLRSYGLTVLRSYGLTVLRSYALTVFFLSPFSFLPLSAQQVQLKGVVTVQNSKTYTGKTQFVKNAEVEHVNQNNAKAKDITGDDGKFTLNIKGAGANTQTQINVTPFGEFADYVVVNEKELKDITLGRLTPVSVFVCKKGELEKRQAEMVGINMRKLEEKMEADKKRLQKELDAIRANNDYLNVRYSQIKDSLDIISKNIDNAFERIKEYAKTMTLENLDDRDENYVKAYACFSRGVLDSVSYYLQEHELDLKYQKIVQLQQESKKEKELAAVLTESAKAKDEFTENSLNELIKEWLLLARTADMQNDYEKAMNFYEKVIQADSLNADIIFEYANYLMEIEMYEKAKEYYFHCLEFFRKNALELPNKYLPLVALTLNNLGLLYRINYELSDALPKFEEALKIHRELASENFKENFRGVVLSLKNIADWYYITNHFSEALQKYEESLKICREFATENSNEYSLLVPVLNSIGAIHCDNHDYYDALPLYEESLMISRKLADDSPKEYILYLVWSLKNIVDLYISIDEPLEALPKCEEALQISRELARENPKKYLREVTEALINLSVIHHKAGNLSEAITVSKEALEIQRKLVADNPKVYLLYLTYNLNNFGNYLSDNEEYDKAMEAFNEALEIRRELAVNNPKVFVSEVAGVISNIACLYFSMGEYLDALKRFEESLNIFRDLAIENPKVYLPEVAFTLSNLACVHLEAKNYDSSLKCLEESLRIYQKLAESNPMVYNNNWKDASLDISNFYLHTQEYAQAEQYARKALEIDKDYAEAKIKLAHALLFKNNISEAEQLYLELSQTLNEENETYSQTILENFDVLEKAGAIPQERKADVEKIREMLKK